MIQYNQTVIWDATIIDVQFLGSEQSVPLALRGLAIQGIKVTTGAPAATAGHWAPSAQVYNAVDATWYIMTGTTASPLWSLVEGAGNAPIFSTETMTSATPGTVRQIYGQIIMNSTMTSGNLVGERGEVEIPNSGHITGGYLYGVQGKIVCGTGTTIDVGSGYVTGAIGQMDISGATTTSGHIAGVISNIQDSSNSARPNVDGFYAETPLYGSGALFNSVLKAIGAFKYGLDLSGVGGMVAFSNIPVSMIIASTVSTGGVHVPLFSAGGTTYYVNVYTS